MGIGLGLKGVLQGGPVIRPKNVRGLQRSRLAAVALNRLPSITSSVTL